METWQAVLLTLAALVGFVAVVLAVAVGAVLLQRGAFLDRVTRRRH